MWNIYTACFFPWDEIFARMHFNARFINGSLGQEFKQVDTRAGQDLAGSYRVTTTVLPIRKENVLFWDSSDEDGRRVMQNLIAMKGHLIIAGHGANDNTGNLRASPVFVDDHTRRTSVEVVDQLVEWHPGGAMHNYFLYFANCLSGAGGGAATIAWTRFQQLNKYPLGIYGSSTIIGPLWRGGTESDHPINWVDVDVMGIPYTKVKRNIQLACVGYDGGLRW